MRLQFYQTYYEDWHLPHLYSFATPYKNEILTDFFENTVIETLVPKCEAEFISVCSWRLKRKRQDGWVPMLCKFPGYDDLSEEKILREDFDIAVLTPKSSSHRMLFMAEQWHKESWTEAFKIFKQFLPFRVPEEVKTPIYENHFIARKQLYHEYVSTILSPALHFMRGHDCFFSDSGYAQKKERDASDPGAVERYRNKTGRQDWPIAPFILERLFSMWIDDKKLKIVNV
jgi:hypothetical protein